MDVFVVEYCSGDENNFVRVVKMMKKASTRIFVSKRRIVFATSFMMKHISSLPKAWRLHENQSHDGQSNKMLTIHMATMIKSD